MITDNNIIMKLFQADTPRVISTEQLYVYIPVASTRTFGGVKPDGEDFVVDEDGVLYLRRSGGGSGTFLQYRGAWAPYTVYDAGDVVTYGGSFYYCTEGHTSSTTISSKFIATYVMRQASGNELGGIKIGYTSAGRNYAVNLTEAGVAYVNVPWTDTTYALVTTTTDGLMSSTDKVKLDSLENIEGVTIFAPPGSTQGVLTDEQVAILSSNALNYIWLSNERYELMDTQTQSGYVIYSHTGCDNQGHFYIKCISIIISTKSWSMESIQVGADIVIPYSDATPSMDGVGSAGTSTNVSRGDHKHPTDTSRASQEDLDTLSGTVTDLDDALSEEIERATEAESDLSDDIGAEVTRATAAETTLGTQISSEVTRATEAEGTIDGKLNYPFAQTVTITASAQVVTVTLSRRNIKSGETDTNSTTIPIANAVNAGLMTPESVTALQQLGTRVSALENTNIHLLYDEDTHPTPADIRQFVINEGYTDTTQWPNIVVEVLGSTNVWKYFDAAHGWTEQVPTVAVATNTTLGIVKGSQTDGKIYVEDDGTLSVNGWNDLQDVILGMQNDIYEEEQRATAAEQALGTRMTTAEGNITSLGTRMTTAETNITTIDGRVDDVEDDIGDLNDITDGLRDDLDTLDSDVSTLGTTVAAHTSSIETNATNIANEVSNRTTAVNNEATARTNADLAIKTIGVWYEEV